MQDHAAQIKDIKDSMNKLQDLRGRKKWPQWIREKCFSVIDGGMPVSQLAKHLKINPKQIYGWRRAIKHHDKDDVQVLAIEPSRPPKNLFLIEVGDYAFRLWRQ